MLKVWIKLENSINRLILKLMALIKKVLIALTPIFVFKVYDYLIDKILTYYFSIRDKFIELTIEVKSQIFYLKDFTFTFLTNLQNFPIKEKVNERIHIFLAFLKVPPKFHLQRLWQFIKVSLFELKEFLGRYSTEQVAISCVVLGFLIFGAGTIVNSGRYIWKSENQSRAPASIEAYHEKPDYHLYSQKTFVVLNVKIPVFRKEVSQVKSVTIDFGVRTSTRFATIFLKEFEYKLKDHFFMTMEPIESSFPIEQEGKNVITEKIQNELNDLLEQEKVEGQVEEVTILYIIAT